MRVHAALLGTTEDAGADLAAAEGVAEACSSLWRLVLRCQGAAASDATVRLTCLHAARSTSVLSQCVHDSQCAPCRWRLLESRTFSSACKKSLACYHRV